MSARRLLVVDLSAIFYWKWHAAAGDHADAAFEWTLGKVHQLAQGFDHVAICCDGRRSHRYDVDPQYKANRPPKDERAVAQLARVKRVLTESGYLLWQLEDREADDLIATVCRWAAGQTPLLEVVIAGTDKDLLQLVGGHGVTMRTLTTDLLYDADAVRAKYGVSPHQLRDWLALVGDASDNIRGVPKVGPKTATQLLQRWKTAQGILAALEKKEADGSWSVQPESVRQSLLSHLDAWDLSMRLVSLENDCAIDCDEVLRRRIANEPRIITEEEAPEMPEEIVIHPPGASPDPVLPTQPTEPAPAPAPTPQSPVAPPAQPTPKPQPRPPVDAKPRAVSRFSAGSVSRAPDKSANRFILTGRSGIGKTFLVSTIPDVFILPIEQGLKGASPDHSPAHFTSVPRTLDELHEALEAFATEVNAPGPNGKRPHRHLAIDGLTGVEMLIHAAVCGLEKVAHMEAKEFKKVWHAAEPLWLKVQRKLDAIVASGVHVWILAHSAEVIDAASQTGETFRKWDLLLKGSGDVGLAIRNLWRSWADHVFFIDWATEVIKGDKTGKRSVGKYKGRVLHTRESATHFAKTRARLPEKMPATWEDLAKAMAAGSMATEPRIRAELAALVAQLGPEDRASVDADISKAQGANALAAVLSRAQGLHAIARESAPEQSDDNGDETVAAE